MMHFSFLLSVIFQNNSCLKKKKTLLIRLSWNILCIKISDNLTYGKAKVSIVGWNMSFGETPKKIYDINELANDNIC